MMAGEHNNHAVTFSQPFHCLWLTGISGRTLIHLLLLEETADQSCEFSVCYVRTRLKKVFASHRINFLFLKMRKVFNLFLLQYFIRKNTLMQTQLVFQCSEIVLRLPSGP